MDALQQQLFQVEKHEELICSICEHVADCYLKEIPPYPITEDLSWCDYNTLCSRLRRYMLDKYPEMYVDSRTLMTYLDYVYEKT